MRGSRPSPLRRGGDLSDTTKIQWADATWNPWIGCTKVSAGCAHCYAENTTRARVLRSQGRETWGKGAQRSRTSEAYWRQPEKWDSVAQACGQRPRVFPSLCDWLDDEVPVEWLADFLKLIYDTPNVRWLLLTKRPENFESRLMDVRKLWAPIGNCDREYGYKLDGWVYFQHRPPKNVWIGVSVENQATADKRIPELLKIPAAIRFLSCEPLLERLGAFHLSGIAWAIIGGESGPKARPCNIEWIRSILDECARAGVACFVKQLGARAKEQVPGGFHALNLADKKGGDPSEWPEDLRVRQFPKLDLTSPPT